MGDDPSVKVGRGIKRTNSQGVCGCVPGQKSGVLDAKIMSNDVLWSKNHAESGLCEQLGAGDESHEGDFVGQRHYWLRERIRKTGLRSFLGRLNSILYHRIVSFSNYCNPEHVGSVWGVKMMFHSPRARQSHFSSYACCFPVQDLHDLQLLNLYTQHLHSLVIGWFHELSRPCCQSVQSCDIVAIQRLRPFSLLGKREVYQLHTHPCR